MRYIMLLASMFFFISNIAYTADNPTGTHYTETYQCSAATVNVEGEKCNDEYDCPYVSMHLWERVNLITPSSKSFPVKPLHEAFKNSKRILRDEGHSEKPHPRLYVVEKVLCLGTNKIGIIYSGGGNCSNGCENYVTYTIDSKRGIIKESLLSK